MKLQCLLPFPGCTESQIGGVWRRALRIACLSCSSQGIQADCGQNQLQELLADPVWWLSSCTVMSFLSCGTLIGSVFGDVWWERTDALKDCHVMREKLGIIYWSVNKDLKDDVLIFHLIRQELNARLLNWSAEKFAAGQCRGIVIHWCSCGSCTFPYTSVSIPLHTHCLRPAFSDVHMVC